MEDLIGQRFSLISKSEIRYVGVLHEINEQDATIALENVSSYGTEGRQVEKFIPPSNNQYEYIVFKGGDVKSIDALKDDEDPQQQAQNIPQDPAIVNSRTGPPQNHNQPPFGHPPPGYPPHQQHIGYYAPPHFGRGFGPPPPGGFGPGPGFPPYGPPPPGYFGPPGQGFPQGPGRFPQPPPIGPPGQQRNAPPNQPPQQSLEAQSGAQPSQPTPELPVDNRAGSKQPSATPTPAPPKASTPLADTRTSATEAASTSSAPTSAPSGPKQGANQPKSNKVVPAVPLTVNQKSFTPPVPATIDSVASEGKAESKPTIPRESTDEATAKAKAAVAQALAKMPQSAPAPKPVPAPTSIDALTKQVREMGPTVNGGQRGRGGARGGRSGYTRQTSGGHQSKKIEIPKSDYDFETANAKFNKEDLIKEAIASGSPVAENADNEADEASAEVEIEGKRKDSTSAAAGKAYNKSTSFFDNISSEAKEREERQDGRANARQMRGEEFKRNVETFGQGNIDGGFRGRGRGYGRGRAYGGTHYRGHYRGNTGPFRGRGRGGFNQVQPQTQPPPTRVAQPES